MDAFVELLTDLQGKFETICRYVLFFVLALFLFLLVSSLCRFLFGKKAQLGKAITAAMEILALYLICAAIDRFGLRWELFSSPLPFLAAEDGSLGLLNVCSLPFSDLCAHVLRLLLIALAVNLLGSVLPEGKKLPVWLVFRCLTVVCAIGATIALDAALSQWTQGIWEYAPALLMGVLVLLILLGSLKLPVGAALFVANPVIGALYTFFFANFFGRALARALLSAALVTTVLCLPAQLGLSFAAVASVGWILWIPGVAALVLAWYAVDRIL